MGNNRDLNSQARRGCFPGLPGFQAIPFEKIGLIQDKAGSER